MLVQVAIAEVGVEDFELELEAESLNFFFYEN